MTQPDFVIEHMAPADLRPHPQNFRRHPAPQRAALAGSLEDHGWLSAPIWNRRTGNLLDGHARVEWAEGREETIPVRVVDVSARQEQRILRAFDAISSMAEIDDGALEALIEEIGDVDLERLLGEIGEPESGLLADADPDAIPEQVETRCKAGDLWRLGEHRLLCGDCTKREDVERLMAGKRASLLATDPPYQVDYTAGHHPPSSHNTPENRDKEWAAYADVAASPDFQREWLSLGLQFCLQQVAIYQWHAHKRQMLVESVWEKCGLLLHQQIIWVKANPVLTHSHLMWQHEPCFYGWPQGHIPEKRPPANATTVWTEANVAHQKMVHPTQKPVELFTRPIEWHTRPTEICYEPFAGSGTQIIAAEGLDRACYAMEISPEFCDVILARYEQATGKTAELIG